MYTTQLLAAVVAFASSSIAAPTAGSFIAPLVAGGPSLPQGGFTVNQVATGIKIRNGAVEVQKTFQKFVKSVPVNVAIAAFEANAVAASIKATVAAQSGSVVAGKADVYDSEYVCPVNIGSTGQLALLDFDTGSSDMLVW